MVGARKSKKLDEECLRVPWRVASLAGGARALMGSLQHVPWLVQFSVITARGGNLTQGSGKSLASDVAICRGSAILAGR
jgi:hypothetical protein